MYVTFLQLLTQLPNLFRVCCQQNFFLIKMKIARKLFTTMRYADHNNKIRLLHEYEFRILHTYKLRLSNGFNVCIRKCPLKFVITFLFLAIYFHSEFNCYDDAFK